MRTPGPWSVNAIKAGRIVGDETIDAGDYDKLQIHSRNCTLATVYRADDARFIADCGSYNLDELLRETNEQGILLDDSKQRFDALTAENARLREALAECTTVNDAMCFEHRDYMKRRIHSITDTARAALAGGER